MTQGNDERALKDLTTKEACKVELPDGRLGSFEELMKEVLKHPDQKLALHFKGDFRHQRT